VEKDYQAHKLNREDAMDHSRWKKQIRDDHDKCEWVNVSSGTSSTRVILDKIQRAVKQLCVCVCDDIFVTYY